MRFEGFMHFVEVNCSKKNLFNVLGKLLEACSSCARASFPLLVLYVLDQFWTWTKAMDTVSMISSRRQLGGTVSIRLSV